MGREMEFGALLADVRVVVEERLAAWLAPKVHEARSVSAEVGAVPATIEERMRVLAGA